MKEITCTLCGRKAARWEDPVDEELCGECEQLKIHKPQAFQRRMDSVFQEDHRQWQREHRREARPI